MSACVVHVCICVRVLSRVCACVGVCVGASSSLQVLYCLIVIFHYPAVVVKNNMRSNNKINIVNIEK